MAYSKKVPHGIMFHHFHNNVHLKSQGSLSQQDFKKLLDYIGLERFLSPSEWLERLDKNKLKAKDLCLTFDDGLLSQIDVALPVLENYGLKAFWFVYSGVFEGQLENLEIYRFFRTKYFNNIDDFYRLFFQRVSESNFADKIDPIMEKKSVMELQKSFPMFSLNDAKFRFIRGKALGRKNYEKIMDSILKEYGADKSELGKNLWMSNKNLKYLSDSGHIVGLHSYSHPIPLADLSFKEQMEEYQKNYLHLERISGKKILAMAHPADSYNNDSIKILNQLGIRCGFRANMFPKQNNGRLNASNLEIVREDHANIMATLKS